MKTLIVTLAASLFLMLIRVDGWSQTTPLRSSYPDTLWTETDTFYVNSDTWDQPWAFTTTQGDTVDLGTDGYEGISLTVYTTTDTLIVPYVNAPFIQHLYIPVASPNSNIIYRLRFNQQSSVYSEDYIKNHTGKVSFSIPETYELANIILYLSDCSKKTGNHPSSEYSNKVEQHFSDFRNHPIVDLLNDQCSVDNPFQPYYNFRENSICYTFENSKLMYDGPYTHVWGFNTQGGIFRKLAYLIQDFAIQSDFQTFFQENYSYYQTLEQRAAELMPVKNMWKWLENEFSNKIQSYQIFFSPLIGGSHSTNKFHHGSFRDSKFYEVAMFINSSESIDQQNEYSDKQKEGLMSGIIFTEIDHNYVNPVTSRYRERVDNIFNNRKIWTKSGGDADNYSSPQAVFNEYMTHAVFCLYTQDTYDQKTSEFVIGARESMMIENRHFTKFDQFNEKLAQLYENKGADEKLIDLYPKILEWAETIK